MHVAGATFASKVCSARRRPCPWRSWKSCALFRLPGDRTGLECRDRMRCVFVCTVRAKFRAVARGQSCTCASTVEMSREVLCAAAHTVTSHTVNTLLSLLRKHASMIRSNAWRLGAAPAMRQPWRQMRARVLPYTHSHACPRVPLPPTLVRICAHSHTHQCRTCMQHVLSLVYLQACLPSARLPLVRSRSCPSVHACAHVHVHMVRPSRPARSPPLCPPATPPLPQHLPS